MQPDRRQILKSASAALMGGGLLARMDKVAGMQSSAPRTSLAQIVNQRATGASEKLLVSPTPGEEGPPQPATVDRLPLEWNKQQVGRFKESLAQRGIESFVLRDRWNVIYLTGYWHTATERPQAVFMNTDDDAPWYLYPALDHDLVTSWWFGAGWLDFDYLHAEGAFPELGKVVQGKTVNLFQFFLEGIKKHGVHGNKIALDGEFYPEQAATAKKVLPGVEWVNVSDVLLNMRELKTPEELLLNRRAYTYFDRAHAYARDYILTYGTDVTDYEGAAASTLWINDILYSELNLANGALQHGVASKVEVGCRVGPLCA
jgi:Xaa-Pro dipeptidase